MKKRHQHFIPRTYLKHFKNSVDSQLLNTFNKIENKFVDNIGINAICVEKDFYTLKNLSGDDRLVLEEYFDKEIEYKYGHVYNLLIHEKPFKITIDQKIDILKTTLSMYFRTPKVLNQFMLKVDNFIEDLINDKNIDEITFKGITIRITNKTKQDIRTDIRESIRTDYLSIQLNFFNELVKFKIHDGITVIENTSEFDFFTGDNPVNFYNEFGMNNEVFDSNNSIYIPLNPKFCLYIASPKLPKSGYEIFYQRDNQMMIHFLNKCTFDNCERWVIGKGENFKIAIQKKLELDSNIDSENPMQETNEKKIILLSNFYIAMKNGGLTNENLDLLKTLNEIKNWDEHRNHIDLVDLLKELRDENGLNI